MSEPEKPTITLSGTRGEEWERVLGTRTFAILSPEAEVLDLDGNQPEQEHCVMLDVLALTPEQRDALIRHLAQRRGATIQAVGRDVYGRGVPIRLGPDAQIEVPPNYKPPRRPPVAKMPNGPFDPRFFT